MHSLRSYEMSFNGKDRSKHEICTPCVIGSTEIEVPMNSFAVLFSTRYLIS